MMDPLSPTGMSIEGKKVPTENDDRDDTCYIADDCFSNGRDDPCSNGCFIQRHRNEDMDDKSFRLKINNGGIDEKTQEIYSTLQEETVNDDDVVNGDRHCRGSSFHQEIPDDEIMTALGKKFNDELNLLNDRGPITGKETKCGFTSDPQSLKFLRPSTETERPSSDQYSYISGIAQQSQQRNIDRNLPSVYHNPMLNRGFLTTDNRRLPPTPFSQINFDGNIGFSKQIYKNGNSRNILQTTVASLPYDHPHPVTSNCYPRLKDDSYLHFSAPEINCTFTSQNHFPRFGAIKDFNLGPENGCDISPRHQRNFNDFCLIPHDKHESTFASLPLDSDLPFYLENPVHNCSETNLSASDQLDCALELIKEDYERQNHLDVSSLVCLSNDATCNMNGGHVVTLTGGAYHPICSLQDAAQLQATSNLVNDQKGQGELLTNPIGFGPNVCEMTFSNPGEGEQMTRSSSRGETNPEVSQHSSSSDGGLGLQEQLGLLRTSVTADGWMSNVDQAALQSSPYRCQHYNFSPSFQEQFVSSSKDEWRYSNVPSVHSMKTSVDGSLSSSPLSVNENPSPREYPDEDRLLKLAVAEGKAQPYSKTDLLAQDSQGDTPLHIAMIDDDWDFAEAILKRLIQERIFVDVINVKNNQKQTPLCLAVIFNKHKIVEMLIENKADVNVHIKTTHENLGVKFDQPLHFAASRGSLWKSTLRQLIKAEDIELDGFNSDGKSPIHCAIESHGKKIDGTEIDCADIIRILAERGANLNQPDGSCEMTPLHYAIEKRDVNLVSRLFVLTDKYSPCSDRSSIAKMLEVATGTGNTALHLAASIQMDTQNHKKLIQLLMSKGADPSRKNSDGFLPRELTKNHEIVELLKGRTPTQRSRTMMT